MKTKRDYVPQMYLGVYDRVIGGGSSRKEAINLKCLECFGWERAEAARCDTEDCPLYHFNSYRLSKIASVLAKEASKQTEGNLDGAEG